MLVFALAKMDMARETALVLYLPTTFFCYDPHLHSRHLIPLHLLLSLDSALLLPIVAIWQVTRYLEVFWCAGEHAQGLERYTRCRLYGNASTGGAYRNVLFFFCT